jgi:hypothetical protein
MRRRERPVVAPPRSKRAESRLGHFTYESGSMSASLRKRPNWRIATKLRDGPIATKFLRRIETTLNALGNRIFALNAP